MLAFQGKDERGVADGTCLSLLVEIDRNCHSLVFARSFWGRYSSQISRVVRNENEKLIPNVLGAVRALLANREKDTKWVQDDELTAIEGLDSMRGVDVGDREFVRAAASVAGSILVTTDGPLRDALRLNGVDRGHDFSVHSPLEALPLAGDDNS